MAIEYMTAEEIKRRRERDIILDGLPTSARDPFTLAMFFTGQELDPNAAPEAEEALARLRILGARKLLRDEIELTERERGLILNCQVYAAEAPAGLPGHNLMLIVAKLATALGL